MSKPMAAIDPTARIESGAVIGNDVTIGPFCVIGANAVVTRDVPPWSVVVGVPGYVVKSRRAGDAAGGFNGESGPESE